MNEDKDYVIGIIQHLHLTHGIMFFITTKDFDVLYNWWEKRIPRRLVEESIAAVVERWNKKNRKIYSFANFGYEVKKNLKAFLQLSVGAGSSTDSTKPQETGAEENELAEIENFLAQFPQELADIKSDFDVLYQKLKNKEDADPEAVHQKLLEMFRDDEELDIKTTIFVRNLAPELRKPKIRQRYRLNYLKNKFNIPDFDI